MYSCLDCFFFFSLFFFGGMPQKPSFSIIFNYEFTVIDTTAKEGFLLIKAKGSSWITDFHIVSGDSIDREHPHGLWWQYGIRTPT